MSKKIELMNQLITVKANIKKISEEISDQLREDPNPENMEIEVPEKNENQNAKILTIQKLEQEKPQTDLRIKINQRKAAKKKARNLRRRRNRRERQLRQQWELEYLRDSKKIESSNIINFNYGVINHYK